MKLRLPLALAAAILAVCSFVSQPVYAATTGNSVSINFGGALQMTDSVTEDTLLGGASVAVKNWNQLATAVRGQSTSTGSSSGLLNQAGLDSGMKVKWAAGGTWSVADGVAVGNAAEQLLFGYLDDDTAASSASGNRPRGARVTVSDIAYFSYDVYIYASTDESGGKFASKYVNGVSYSYNAEGKLVAGATNAWGAAGANTLTENVNYMKVTGLNTGSLIVEGGLKDGSNRGGIAGIQIVNTYEGIVTDYTLTGDSSWSSVVKESGVGHGQVFDVVGSGVSLNLGGAVTTDGIVLRSGKLTLTGGSFANAPILNVFSGSTLYLDMANLAFAAETPLFTGTGDFSFIGSWVGGFSHNVSLLIDNGSLTFSTPSNATFANATIKGNGDLIKTGTGQLLLDKPANGQFTFSGNVIVKEGDLKWGNDNGVGSDYRLGSGSVIVESGAKLTLHIKDNNANILNNIVLKNGATLYTQDRTHNLKEGLTLEGGKDSSANIQFYWDKTLNIDGILRGEGTLKITGSTMSTNGATVSLNNDGNTFSGTFSVVVDSASDANLKITQNNAARNASVVLNGSETNKANLKLEARDITLSSLTGNATSLVSTSIADGMKLTLTNGGDLSGTLSGLINLHSLADLTLGGKNTAYTGSLVFSGANLTLSDAASLGLATLELLKDTTLKGVAAAYKNNILLHGNTTITSSLDTGITLTGGQTLILQADATAANIVWAGDLTFGGGALSFVSSSQGKLSGLKVTGTTTKGAGTTAINISLQNAYLDNGSHLLVDFGSAALDASAFNATGFNAHFMRGQKYDGVKVEGGKLYAVLSGGTRGNLSWNVASGDWGMTGVATPPWTGSPDTTFYAGDNVTFGTLPGIAAATVNLTGTVLPGGFMVNADATTTYTFSGAGVIAGAAQLVKSGAGILVWNTTGAHTYYGGTDIQGGTLLWQQGNFGTGAVNVGTDGILQLWAEGAVAPTSGVFAANVTGTGNIAVWAADYTVLKLGNDFAGDITVKSGLVSFNSSLLGTNSTIVLNGGGILANNDATIITGNNPVFSNNIEVGEGGGVIQIHGAQTATLTGKISGSGKLTRTDSGTLTLTGDMSGFSGSLEVLATGSTVLNTKSIVNMTEFYLGNGGAAAKVTFGKGSVFNMSSMKFYQADSNYDNEINIYGKVRISDRLYMDGKDNWRHTKISINILDDEAELSVKKLDFFEERNAATINLKAGVLSITGDAAYISLGGSERDSYLNQSGGTFNSLNSYLMTSSWTAGNWNVSGGIANVKGVDFRNPGGKNLRLGKLNWTGGTINLGNVGIKNYGPDVVLNAGNITLGGLDSWSSDAKMTMTGRISFNTQKYDAAASTPGYVNEGVTITWNGILDGTGDVIVQGMGKLILAGENTFAGNVILRGGSLGLNNAGALGKAGQRRLFLEGGANTLSGASGVTVLADDLVWGGGNLLLEGISLTVSGSTIYGGSGNLSMKGATLTLTGDANNVFSLGLLDQMSGSNVIDHGASKMTIGVADTYNGGAVSLVGNGAVLVSGANALSVNSLDGYLYAGTGGVNVTGASSNASMGIYGGSWDPQTETSGGIVVGSTDASVNTNIVFASADSKTDGIFGAKVHLGNQSTPGVNTSVLSNISLKGVLTADKTTSNTVVNGRLFGGGANGANIYGSTKLTLSGVHFIGSDNEYMDTGVRCLAGGGFAGTTVFGNVTTQISDSIVESRIYGTGGSVKGNVNLTISGSTVNHKVLAGTYGESDMVDGILNVNINESTLRQGIYGLRDGIVKGKVKMNLTNTTVHGSVVAGATVGGGTHVKGGAEINLDGVTADYVGLAGSSGDVVEGDSTITIQGNSVIKNINATGGVPHTGSWANTLAGGKVTGNVTVNIKGGKIGEGLTGSAAGVMSMVATDGYLKGDATLNVSGGQVLNEYLAIVGVGTGSKLEGNAYLNLSGTGQIASNIRSATSSYPGSITGNWNIVLDGGILGQVGATRSLDAGAAGGNAIVVGKDVNITLDGTLSGGVGTQILGTYSILAGATNGTVGGNTSVTLSNITKNGGVADFTGIISGANATGGGVAGMNRTLTFNHYTTGTSAQYKHFSLAKVQGASAVEMLSGASASGITAWDILDTSTLTISKTAHLGSPTSITIAEDAGLIVNAGEAIDMGTVDLIGSGTVTKKGTASLSMSGESADFAGTVDVTAGNLILTGGANSFGTNAVIELTGGALSLEKTEDSNMGALLTGSGALTVNNTAGVKTTLTNTSGSNAYTGSLNINKGILELASGVRLGRSNAAIGENGTLNIKGNLSESVGQITNTTAGKGTLALGSSNTLNSGSQISSFTGILSLESGVKFTVAVEAGSQLLNNGVTVGFQGSAEMELNNQSGAVQGFTLGSLVLQGVDNTISFSGTGTNLVITNGDSWLSANAESGMGQITFDITGSGESSVVITNLSNKNVVFANIFMQKDGILYQTQANDAGRLVEITLDQMTELPGVGVPSLESTTFKITDGNADLSGGVLTMQGASQLSSINIVSSAGNRAWNLNGHNVLLSGGSLMFQGNSDYTISGGTLSSGSGILGISQMATGNTLTISAGITEKTVATTTSLKKMGGGKLVLEGNLSNKGGLQVVGGTLILKGQATGSATSGILSNNATLELGDGTNNFVLGYAETQNTATGTLSVSKNAVLGGKVTNAGTIILKEGGTLSADTNLTNNKDLQLEIGQGKTMSLPPITGTGTIRIKSGTFITTGGNLQNFDLTEDTQLTWNLSGTASTGRIMTGEGKVLINNASGSNLDLENAVLGTKWNGYTGTLELKSAGSTMRTKFSTDMGASLIIVGAGTQYWDNASASTRASDWKLTGSGGDDFGALRISKSGTYTGTMEIAAGGARISSENIPVTLSGTISGGRLELGTQNTSYTSIITLSGANSHSQTKAIGKSRIIANSQTALGGSLDLSGAETSAEIKTNTETGDIQGVTGSSLTLSDASLTITGTTSATYAGNLYGTGALIKKGTGSWTLSGSNTWNGAIQIENGSLNAGSTTAYGAAGNRITITGGGRADLGGYAINQSITLNGTAQLSGAGNYAGRLILSGHNGETSQTHGDLKAGSLIMQEAGARLNVSGNLTVTGGGSLYLSAGNANQSEALIKADGNIRLGGAYELYMDTNSAYQGTSVKYKLFESASYPGKESDYTFELGMDPAYNEYFQLKDNYKQEMVQSGSVTVTINVKAVVGQLVNDQDIADLGAGGYQSQGESFYLGAKTNEGTPAYFDKTYTIAAGDHAYRLTNGEGWLTFATQMSGDNKLVLSKYLTGTNPDSGVTLTNNNNNYTGGTSSLNVHLTIDSSLNPNQPMPANGRIGALGSGNITLLGREAILELRANGEGTGNYTLDNTIDLRDGAQIWQSGGAATTLTGNITASGTEGGIISNQGNATLTLTGSLTANKLSHKGGSIQLSGTGTTAEIGELSLSDTAQLTVSDRNLTAGSLTLEKGSNLTAGNGSQITLGTLTQGTAGTGTASLTINGGSLNLTTDTHLGGNDQIKLNLGQDTTNTLNIAQNTTIDLTSLQESDGNLTKTGEGTLNLGGTLSAYKGTVAIQNGQVNLTAASTTNNYTINGTTARLEITANSSHTGALTIGERGTATIGNNVTLNGDLTVSGSTLSTGKDTQLTSSRITLNDGAQITLGENTRIGNGTDTQITIGQNTTIHFGTGSRLEGPISEGLTFGQGSTYEGNLDAGANQVTFGNNSNFQVDGSKYDQYTSGKTLLTGSGNITLENGMKINLDKFAETMSPLPVDMGLISTSGTLSLGGQEVKNGQNYNQYLGDNPYIWLAFDLMGGANRLDLHIQKDVQFGRFADTKNEAAIADLASDLALHNDQYKGELGKLGTALVKATNANVNNLLGDLALSTSSALSGYSVQIQNLKRHSQEIMNRAIQTKPDNTRLSYEDSPSTIWANGIGGTYKTNGTANALGNTANIWGGTLGVSTTVSETTVIGMAFTYTNSDIKIDRGMGKTTQDAYTIDLFARYHKDNWNLTGIITGGMTSSDMERNLALEGYTSRSKGTADGSQIMGMIQAGYEFTVSQDQNSILEPLVQLSCGYSGQDGYKESGAGTAGLNIDSENKVLSTIGTGVRFVREYLTERETGSLAKGRFEIRALILQDLSDQNPEINASFQGAPQRKFKQEGNAPGKTALLLGAGIVHPLSENTAVFADVDGEFRNRGTGVGANVGVKYTF